jgi:hypothetical protein
VSVVSINHKLLSVLTILAYVSRFSRSNTFDVEILSGLSDLDRIACGIHLVVCDLEIKSFANNPGACSTYHICPTGVLGRRGEWHFPVLVSLGTTAHAFQGLSPGKPYCNKHIVAPTPLGGV